MVPSKQARYRRRQLDGLACFRLDDLPVVPLEDMLRATRLLHVIKPDRSANSGNDCEVAADFRIDARNEKLCEKSLIAEDTTT